MGSATTAEAEAVPPRVRDDAQPVGLDQKTGVPDERDPRLPPSPSGCGHDFLDYSHDLSSSRASAINEGNIQSGLGPRATLD